VSAACLARAGHQVIGVDTNNDKVTMINAGRSPVVEPGLDALLADLVKTGRLRATNVGTDAVRDSDLAMICVGTPSQGNGQLDVNALVHVGEEIGRALVRHRKGAYTVVLRSTVLPGTTQGIVIPALYAGTLGRHGASTRVAVNPEFMREGSALHDFARPPLTLVGCDQPESVEILKSLYRGVEAPFVHTSIKTAEMVKYTANAYHALKVCFANEIGDVCQALGADAQEVLRIFRMDQKLNLSGAYLHPGFAFGGSCLPKDLRALLHAARHADVPLPLLGAILPSNEAQIHHAIKRVLGTGKRRIGVVGLAFKPGTDDLRESPMVTLVETLIGKGCQVRILDRNVSIARLVGANRRYIEQEIPHIASLMCDDPDKLLHHAEVIVIGGASEEATEVLNEATTQQTVVDLTRGAVLRFVRETVQA
jgi:GDP-mannose 6-dehydrogenase